MKVRPTIFLAEVGRRSALSLGMAMESLSNLCDCHARRAGEDQAAHHEGKSPSTNIGRSGKETLAQ